MTLLFCKFDAPSQTRAGRTPHTPAMSVYTDSLLDALRHVGSYTDNQLNHMGARVATVIGAILPSVLVFANECRPKIAACAIFLRHVATEDMHNCSDTLKKAHGDSFVIF